MAGADWPEALEIFRQPIAAIQLTQLAYGSSDFSDFAGECRSSAAGLYFQEPQSN